MVDKNFDRTKCFMFFGNWLDVFSKIETESDQTSVAYTLFKAIANYSLYEEVPDFESFDAKDKTLLTSLWIMLVEEIDRSVDNRSKNFRNGKPTKKQQEAIIACAKYYDESNRGIEEITGIPKTTAATVRERFKGEIEALADELRKRKPDGDGKSVCDGILHADSTPICSGNSYGSTYGNAGTGQNGTIRDSSGQSGTDEVGYMGVRNPDDGFLFGKGAISEDDGDLPF